MHMGIATVPHLVYHQGKHANPCVTSENRKQQIHQPILSFLTTETHNVTNYSLMIIQHVDNLHPYSMNLIYEPKKDTSSMFV